ncbi:MAG TPA: DMT family transporter [Actinomycetota bacterium]|jgi:drug/metabolite transporter (DMT)-like permease|nr:DMT family transporter [Actinomycetota bacterium]
MEERARATAGMRARRTPDLGLLLFLTPLIWGLTFPAGKVALERLSVPAFMAWSRTLGFLILVVSLPMFARAGARWPDIRRAIPPGLVLGALLFLGYALQTAGLARTSATNAGFITGLYVVFTPVLALVVLRQPTGPAAWAAVAISVVGLAFLSVESLDAPQPRFGDLLVLASAVAWAGHVVAVGRFTGRFSSTGLALNQMAVASGFHLVGSFVVGTGLQPQHAASVWTMLFLTGILGSGVAFTLQVFAQRRLTPVRAAIILAGESVFAALFAAVWLGERLLPHQWLGAAFTVSAMVLSEVGARRRPAEQLNPATAA